MTEDVKNTEVEEPIEVDQAPEPVLLTPDVLEQVLVSCIWDVLRRMHRVVSKAMTADQATQEDDAVVRHLARTLMGENPGFTMALPLAGPNLIEELRKLPEYADEKLPKDIDAANPRAVAVFVCRDYLHAIYDMVRSLNSQEELTREALENAVQTTAAFWLARFTGVKSSALN